MRLRLIIQLFTLYFFVLASSLHAEEFKSRSVCGVEGTISQRIENCALVLPNKCQGGVFELRDRPDDCATIVIESHRVKDFNQVDKDIWQLVLQTADGLRAWRDESSGMIWIAYPKHRLDRADAKKACQELAVLPVRFSLPSEAEISRASEHGLSEVGTCIQNKMFWTASEEREWGLFKDTISYVITSFVESYDGTSRAAFSNISNDKEEQGLLCAGPSLR